LTFPGFALRITTPHRDKVGEFMPEPITEFQFEYQKDKHKVLTEYLRFLITLSTGSIVLLTSFLERLAPQPNLGFLVSIALTAFMVSVVTSVVAYTFVVMNFGLEITGPEGVLSVGAIVITWISFLVAIIALTIFGLANL
jgi:hypothetical protein